MARARYGVGDIVSLTDGPLRQARNASTFTVLAVLPEADGQTQYRVRSEQEGFDRRISAGEIDVERSGAPSHADRPAAAAGAAKEPWFKPLSTRNGK